jgi:hypothetical protein
MSFVVVGIFGILNLRQQCTNAMSTDTEVGNCTTAHSTAEEVM